jgi:hypothetical protein
VPLKTSLTSSFLSWSSYTKPSERWRICVLWVSILPLSTIFLFNITIVPTVWYFYYYYYKCGHRNVMSKRQVWMSIFQKQNSWTQGSWIFFNKKIILDYYFCLMSGPVFLFQICIIAPLPLPRDIKLYH